MRIFRTYKAKNEVDWINELRMYVHKKKQMSSATKNYKKILLMFEEN